MLQPAGGAYKNCHFFVPFSATLNTTQTACLVLAMTASVEARAGMAANAEAMLMVADVVVVGDHPELSDFQTPK